MLQSINIKGFKKIKDLTLDGLTDVNYLVGENGSGKSSVLEGVYIFSQHSANDATSSGMVKINNPNLYQAFGDLRSIFSPNSEFRFRINNVSDERDLNYTLISNSFQSTEWKLLNTGVPGVGLLTSNGLTPIYCHTAKIENVSTLSSALQFDFENINDNSAQGLSSFLNEYYYESRDDKIFKIVKSLEGSPSIQFLLESGKTDNFRAIASGLKSVISFYFSLQAIAGDGCTKPHILDNRFYSNYFLTRILNFVYLHLCLEVLP